MTVISSSELVTTVEKNKCKFMLMIFSKIAQ